MKIAMIGTGYVGLVSGVCFSDFGHEVVCVDKNPQKIEMLKAGEVPIYEPGLEDLVQRNKERLHFELDVAPLMEHARLLFVCVDTPPTYSGDADLSRVEAVIEDLPASGLGDVVFDGLGRAVRQLVDSGKRVVLVVDNPTLPDPKECMSRQTMLPWLTQAIERPVRPRCTCASPVRRPHIPATTASTPLTGAT